MAPTIPARFVEPALREERRSRRRELRGQFAVLETRARRHAELRSLPESLAAVDELIAVLARAGPVFAQFGRYLGTRPDAIRPEHCLHLCETGTVRSMPPEELRPWFRQRYGEVLPPWAQNLSEDLARSDHLVHVYRWRQT